MVKESDAACWNGGYPRPPCLDSSQALLSYAATPRIQQLSFPMASAAISSDLQSLLPTLVGPIPSELVNLATSLLAQSRSRISNLKPTEEVARNYVCAHLACER